MPEVTSSPAEVVPAKEGRAHEAASRELFQASQTFLLRQPDPRVLIVRYTTVGSLLIMFFLVVPLLARTGRIESYRLPLLGKYLCYAIVALGVDVVWGYTGLLSLCQALFFALGGYAMAMHLSLQQGGGDVRPEDHYLPQFLSFNSLTTLPLFWKPFTSLALSLLAGLTLPTAIAAIFGFLVLRNRIRGVYFSIITQALALASWLLISRNEMLLGGANGLTNYSKDWQSPGWALGLYLLTLTVLVMAYILCRALVKSRLGRVLVAIRDKETRLYFAGYKPHTFKVFAFAFGAGLAGIGGMLYPAQVGIINPQQMDVRESIIIVVGVALGGRGKLWGAAFGALLLCILQSALTSDFASIWLAIVGSIAIGVVLFLPEGFAGIWERMERQIASGAPFWRWALAGVPLLAVVLFAVGQVLGLTPHFLNVGARLTLGIPSKYVVLVAVLAAAVLLDRLDQRRTISKARAVALQPSKALAPAIAGGGI